MNAEQSYRGEGILRYRGAWIILDVHSSIVDYYHAMIQKHYRLIRLNKPFNDAHVTVVAGKYEDCTVHEQWNKHEGATIPFQYNGYIHAQDRYFWLEIDAPALTCIRQELGLSDLPKWPFHLTVANLKGLSSPI